MTDLGSNSSRSRGTRDVFLDKRTAIVARVRAHGPFALLLTQAIELPLVTGSLGLLLAKHLAVIWIDLNEQGEEGVEDVESGNVVSESGWEGRGEEGLS